MSAYLAGFGPSSRRMSFGEIEEVLGFSLPASARQFPAWWANDPNPSRHSHSWLSAGWETGDLDLAAEQVTFRRAGTAQEAAPRPRPEPPRGTARSHPPAAEAVPEGDPVQLALTMQWLKLGLVDLDGTASLRFPSVPSAPGLYRFRLVGEDSLRCYIGETADLRRRFAHYRKPGPTQATNIRLNELLLAHLGGGGRVELDVVTGGVLLVIGEARVQADLADKATRRLLEHAALVAQGGAAVDSLNR
ncbi:hypothetical protein JL101_004670 [Skermanella rosea]|uniref:DUF7662 domain-containing protein n=1 Tax=Skermanella rosea TaxID=1817965 RepID=UPI0019312C87|nr:hypothetical protein [Skermanella rosea]UEM04739.1 hypothetical protein JL101_004670 [Skermanella rosea]